MAFSSEVASVVVPAPFGKMSFFLKQRPPPVLSNRVQGDVDIIESHLAEGPVENKKRGNAVRPQVLTDLPIWANTRYHHQRCREV